MRNYVVKITDFNNTKPFDFIERFCNRLKIDDIHDVQKIKDICEIAVKHNIITENTPPSITSGCIYFYTSNQKKNISRKEISDVCKISEVTINKCSKKLEENLELFNEIVNNTKKDCDDA